jgi:hypothetical protein
MRRSIAAAIAVTALVAYAGHRPSSEPTAEAVHATTAEVRVVGPVRAAIAGSLRPTLVAPSVPRVLDLIDPDQDPPLPAAPPRTVHGRLLDLDGDNAVGATVIVTSPNLRGEQVVITDDDGYFRIVDLPIGEYLLTVYYNDRIYTRASLDVNDRLATAVEEVLDPSDSVALQPPPVADPPPDVVVNIPTGRTFEAVLGVTTGSQDDNTGVSIAGVT